MKHRHLTGLALFAATGLLLAACENNNSENLPSAQKEAQTDSQSSDQESTDQKETDTDHSSTDGTSTDQDNTDQEGTDPDEDDDYECVLDGTAPVIPANPDCQAPTDTKAKDGYPCWEDSECESNKCEGYYCASSTGKLAHGATCTKDAECLSQKCEGEACAYPTITDVPNGGACTYSECASGHCIYNNATAHCAETCKKGATGDGTYYCGPNLFDTTDSNYYCQADPKLGQKCCKNSDCGPSAVCFNEVCVLDCSEGMANCPSGSTCTYFATSIGDFNYCITDSILGSIPAGGHCGNDKFCASGHCKNNVCQDLSQVNCAGPHDYPDFDQPDGYPCNYDDNCASGTCDISENAFICTDDSLYHEIHGLPDNAPCLLDSECDSGYCWFNGGALFNSYGWSDASYCARPCDPKYATSDGNFACQKNNFDKYICSPVRNDNSRGQKGAACQITEFDCNEGLTCNRDNSDKVCKGL